MAELDLCNYATNIDLKEVTYVNTSHLEVASVKSQVRELDVNKLEIVSAYLCKLKDGVNSDVTKKTDYSELVTKANAINARK